MTDKTPAMPELPEPALYAHELILNGGGVWLGVPEKGICEQSYVEGETGEEIREFYTADQMRAYALAALQSAQPAAAEYNGWYCAHCQRGVDAIEVTYHEQHTVCGRVITNDVPPAPQPAAAVSDDDILVVAEFVGLIGPGSRVGESHSAAVRFARAIRAILALRPQAVPMTDERLAEVLTTAYGSPEWTMDDARAARAVEAEAHGINQRADGGEG